MKDMRMVCKTWAQGFELGVAGVKISASGPELPSEPRAMHLRFSGLTCLDMGRCQFVGSPQLERLMGLKTLVSLRLGDPPTIHHDRNPPEAALVSILKDEHIEGLKVRLCYGSVCWADVGSSAPREQLLMETDSSETINPNFASMANNTPPPPNLPR